jgi:hypothetical protein
MYMSGISRRNGAMAMATKRCDDWVTFVVTYANRRTSRIPIDRFRLRRGDFVALEIAHEVQKGGELPPGEIVEVRRAPSEEQPLYRGLRSY